MEREKKFNILRGIIVDSFLTNETKKELIDFVTDYEDAEENGMLIRFPCRVGTHIYIVNRRWHVVEAGNICGISECDNVDCLCYRVYVDPDTYTDILISDFGKEWFLTESEAEQALKQMGE